LEYSAGAPRSIDLGGQDEGGGGAAANSRGEAMGVGVIKHRIIRCRCYRELLLKAVVSPQVGLDRVNSGENRAGQTRFLNILLIVRDCDRSQDTNDRN